jgi:hypothetical protein
LRRDRRRAARLTFALGLRLAAAEAVAEEGLLSRAEASRAAAAARRKAFSSI